MEAEILEGGQRDYTQKKTVFADALAQERRFPKKWVTDVLGVFQSNLNEKRDVDRIPPRGR